MSDEVEVEHSLCGYLSAAGLDQGLPFVRRWIHGSLRYLFLLKRGGKEIYVGQLGRNSCHLIKYFEEIQGVPKIKAGSKPAAWMLDVTTPAQEASLGVDFAEIYKSSDQFRRTKALIQELSIPEEGSKQLSFPTQFAQPFFTQFVAFLWKQHCSYWNNSLYASRRVNSAFIAFILRTVYWDLGTQVKRKQDLFSSMGSMYISAVLRLVLTETHRHLILCLGCDPDTIPVDANFTVWYRCLCNDRIRVDCRKVLLVPVLQVPNLCLFHLLGHDDDLAVTGSKHFSRHIRVFLCHVEPLFGFYNPKTSDSDMVEMVFLDLSNCLELARSDHIPIRKHHRRPG
ncbi:Pleiotropic drug resistance protein 1-like protein [Drosera capensis]